MIYHTSLTEDELRCWRRKNRIVEDGEHVTFDLAFRDSASSFMTDSAGAHDAQSLADRQQSALAHAEQQLNGWRQNGPDAQSPRTADAKANDPHIIAVAAAYQRSVDNLNGWRDAPNPAGLAAYSHSRF